jgi:hypothetical protein
VVKIETAPVESKGELDRTEVPQHPQDDQDSQDGRPQGYKHFALRPEASAWVPSGHGATFAATNDGDKQQEQETQPQQLQQPSGHKNFTLRPEATPWVPSAYSASSAAANDGEQQQQQEAQQQQPKPKDFALRPDASAWFPSDHGATSVTAGNNGKPQQEETQPQQLKLHASKLRPEAAAWAPRDHNTSSAAATDDEKQQETGKSMVVGTEPAPSDGACSAVQSEPQTTQPCSVKPRVRFQPLGLGPNVRFPEVPLIAGLIVSLRANIKTELAPVADSEPESGPEAQQVPTAKPRGRFQPLGVGPNVKFPEVPLIAGLISALRVKTKN